MLPTLFKIGSFEIQSFPVFLVLAFVSGIILSVYRTRIQELDQNQILDLSIGLIFSSMHVITIIGPKIIATDKSSRIDATSVDVIHKK